MSATRCEDCGADLHYERDGRSFSRLIGVEYQGVYDGVSEWQCPDCRARRGRWSGKLLAEGEHEKRFGR